MDRGYIKFWRKYGESDLWLSEPFTKGQAFFDIVQLANHKDGFIFVRGLKCEIKRGQTGRSELTLAARWRWSRGKVRRFLNFLEIEGKIVQQKDNITTLITIINYEKYAGNGTADDTANGHQTDTKRYTNKNVKNVKNNNINPEFEKFYSAYPLKKSKADALKIFERLKKKNELPEIENLIQAIRNQQDEKDYLQQVGKFCPEWKHPSTWLNQKCWQDGIVKPSDINKPVENKACPSWY